VQHPNLLIFMTDQQRGRTALPGGPAKMPVLEAFREQAVTFSRAYCPSPHCCPSRATFFTGLYPSEHGVWNNVCVPNALSTGLKAGVRLWSEDLAEAGYDLHFNGKWHVSYDEGPEERGWTPHFVTANARKNGQRIMGHTWDMWRGHEEPDKDREPGQILRPGWGTYRHYFTDENPFSDREVVKSAREVMLNSGKEHPWCHYVGTLGPHDPYTPPREFLDWYDPDRIQLPDTFEDRMEDKPGMYRRIRDRFDQLSPEEHREAIRHYLALCSFEDALFGEVLMALEESGQADNTIVLYLSDHGDYMAEHGLWCKGLCCFESAYHVPLSIRWPGVTDRRGIAGSVQDAFVSLADFAPTFREMAGIEAASPCSGQSLVPFLTGTQPETWRDAVFTQSNGNELYGVQRSIMTDDWKLVYNGFDYDELYDLREDPGETVNLARNPAYKEMISGLYRRLWQFACKHGDTAINNYIFTAFAEYGPGWAFTGQSSKVNS